MRVRSVLRARAVAACAAAAVAVTGCITHLDRAVGHDVRQLDHDAHWLKAHMANGDVYVLTDWHVVEKPTPVVIGQGRLLGVDRATVQEGWFHVPISDVALFETDDVSTSPSVAALAVVTVASIAVTAACAANPKACFGSCPTFYAPADDGGAATLSAEGFSDSIAPALEASDVDALWKTRGAPGQALTLRMTNEAYETHVVKAADVLVAPRPRGGRVLSTGEAFWQARALAAPTACRAPEGDCAAALASVDGVERSSKTDEHDLGARETIELDFPAASDAVGAGGAGDVDAGGAAPRYGVAIATRQTLVTTFLLYQGLAWLGSDAASTLARLGAAQRAGGSRARHLLGGIEVQVPDPGADDGWRTVDEIYETGPIATDVHLVVLPEGARGERVRLRLSKGGWRLDAVMRATLGDEVTPVRLAPARIRGTLSPTYGAGRTAATALPLITEPGDAYALTYQLPAGDAPDGYELFLESRGYYLEWMRGEWLTERDPLQAWRMLLAPDVMLKELAPRFKELEPHMEEIFWRSRYAHP